MQEPVGPLGSMSDQLHSNSEKYPIDFVDQCPIKDVIWAAIVQVLS